VACTRVHAAYSTHERTARTEGTLSVSGLADGGCLLTSGGSDIADSAVTCHSFGKARRARTEERGSQSRWCESRGAQIAHFWLVVNQF
jgi:hypothetical protein